MKINLHQLLDFHYGSDGDAVLRRHLAKGPDPDEYYEGETLLHVAVRRRRRNAAAILLDHGANIDAKTANGKTAYAHVTRRGFGEVAVLLAERGANTDLNAADRLAVAIVNGRFDEARKILADHPGCVHTGNPEEDRLLADVAGRSNPETVALLIAAGADLSAPGLDDGTPLHQSAWFGQPANARLLLDAGAPIDIFDAVHQSSPLGWAVHGSRYSGGAEQCQEAYVELVRILLDAGSSLHYPGEADSDAYLNRLRKDATARVRELLPVSG